MPELIKREYVYRGRVVSLRLDTVRFKEQDHTVREVIEHADAVAIVALDRADRVTLVRQERAGAGRALLEIPAGVLDENETPEAAGPRELREETGLTANRWDFLARFFSSPGVLTEEMYIYLARELEQGEQNLMDDEEIELAQVTLDEALALIARGEIVDAKSIIGLLLAQKHLASERSIM